MIFGFSHVVQQLSVFDGGAPKQAVFNDHLSFAPTACGSMLGGSMTKARAMVHIVAGRQALGVSLISAGGICSSEAVDSSRTVERVEEECGHSVWRQTELGGASNL